MSRKVDRETRRRELVAAAGAEFARRGLSATAVSDIVKAAGVAQGTFYLYFASKDEAVLAVVESIGDDMISAITAAVDSCGTTAVDKLLALRDVLAGFDIDPGAGELVDFIHRKDNHALHDRLAETLIPRLVPLVESIVAQGVADAVFDVPDPRAAAWFVLGGLHSIELSGGPAARMPGAIHAATDLALRALGHDPAAR